MGHVYRAFDTRLQRQVALKVLDPGTATEAEVVSAALREARAAAAVHHPCVAAIYDAGTAGGRAFLVMELVRGTALRRLVGDASIEIGERVRWLADVASALAAAHALGVLHRDVKPENVIVRDDGAVKVLDFGVARLPRTPDLLREEGFDTLTGGALVGTPEYMAPEQIRGLPTDGRVDQFGWGVLAYELLTGSVPWTRSREPLQVLLEVLSDKPVSFPPLEAIPAGLVAVVLQALSKSPDQRFASMGDIVAALGPFMAPPPLLRSTTSQRVPAFPRATTSPLPVAPRATTSPVPVAPRATTSPVPVAPRSTTSPQVPALPRSRTSQEIPVFPRPTTPTLRVPAPPRSSPSGGRFARSVLSPIPREAPGPPSAGPRFRDPDFAAPVNLEAHLALLPPDAATKGMFVTDLFDAASRVLTPTEIRARARVPERRPLPFINYPMSENLRMLVVVAGALYPGLPLGEGLRRIGHRALDAFLGSQIGRTVMGVLGVDFERILLAAGKAYSLTLTFGKYAPEKAGPGRYLVRVSKLPVFLETYQVGIIEGAMRHCHERGRVRLATEGLADGMFEIELVSG
jgi:serine/threonine-protein kinase